MLAMFKSRWSGIYASVFLVVVTVALFSNNDIVIFMYRENYQKLSRQNLTPKTFKHTKEQEQRLHHLKTFCGGGSNLSSMINLLKSRKNNIQEISISNKKKLIYCGVPKIATTNWKRLLLFFENKIPYVDSVPKKESVHEYPQIRFNSINKQHREYILLNYYKFLFVRHPFTRLVSAYRNKFIDNKHYYEGTYGSRILKLYRNNLTKEEYKAGKGVTFIEFVRWIKDKHINNDHWLPIHKLCHPCTLSYDFIGKMETLIPDSEQVLQDIHAYGIHFPANMTDYTISSEILVHTYFKNVPKKLLLQLYDLYKADFLAFGYTIPKSLLY